MSDLITPLFNALLGAGPAGLIAAFEFFLILALGYGLWHFVKQRNGHASLTKQHATELKKVQESQASKISDIHEGYQKQLTELNTARITDIKEMNGEYSELAEKMTDTMNRLAHQLELRAAKET